MKLAIQRALNEVNRPTDSGDMAVGANVICKLKLWTAAILNLCKLTTFPVSKSWRLFIRSSEEPNKQVKANKPSIAICSKSSPTLTGLSVELSDVCQSCITQCAVDSITVPVMPARNAQSHTQIPMLSSRCAGNYFVHMCF